MRRFGERIESLRRKAGLSQAVLGEMMEMKRVTLSKIENNERKICADELIRFAQVFNLSLDQLVNPSLEPEVVVEDDQSKTVTQEPVRISVPQQNIRKFKQVMLYILNKVGAKPNVGQKVLYKLLYFIDFNYYEKYHKQLVGAKYIRNNHGPTPTEFSQVVEEMKLDNEIEEVKSEYFHYPMSKYLPLINPDLSVLNANEIKMIDFVLDRMAHMDPSRISLYAHNDAPWMMARDGQALDYEAVFRRSIPYSVLNEEI